MIDRTKTISRAAMLVAGVLTTLPGVVEAQTATAPVVGVKEQTLSDGQFNLVGLNLHNSVLVSGTLDAVSGTTLTENDVTLTTPLGASGSATYILEITSGSLAGTIQEITAWGANTLTTPQDLASEGLVSGTTYVIRKAATLQQVLGNPAIIGASFTATSADVVWVPDGSGDYTRYFYQGAPLNRWFNATTSAAVTQDIPLVYSDGFLIQVKNGNVTIPLSGAVKDSDLTVAVAQGFNLVSNTYPEGSTLQNTNLKDTLAASFTATSADVVWLPDGSGDYVRYFYQPNPLNRWFNATTSNPVVADVPLPSAFFIQRKGSATNVDVSAP